MDENQERYEIDLLQILSDLLKRWYVIAISGVVAAIIALAYTFYFVTPQYRASVMMYVNNTTSATTGVTYNDITTARSLVETYVVILTSRDTLERVIDESGLNCEYTALKGMISAQVLNETEVFSISITHSDPYTAAKVANTIARVLPEKIDDIVQGSSVKVIDEASIPTSPSSPSYKKNVAIGLLLGVVLGASAVLIYEFMNDKIKSEDWIDKNFGDDVPLLAIIPDLSDKTSYNYGRYRKYGYYTSSKQKS